MRRNIMIGAGLVVAVAAFVNFTATSKEHELTIDRLVASPNLAGTYASGLKMSPDGTRVTFLQGKATNSGQLDLWEYNIQDGVKRMLVDSEALLGKAEVLSEVEKARRERQRVYTTGIVEYYFSDDGKALLFPLGGDVYHLPIGGTVKRLTSTDAYETDIRFSPKGRYASYVREQNLYIYDLAAGAERPITREGGGTVSYATAEFVAQEEMDRVTGYWWSPNEKYIALSRIEEAPVKVVDRYELGDGGVTTITQRYPFAGTANVEVKLGVVTLMGAPMKWVPLGDEEDIYLTRVNWLADGENVSYQVQSRDQKTLDLMVADAETTTAKRLVKETSDTWLNLNHDLFHLSNGDFIWTSERDGFRHIYLFDNNGNVKSQLTKGSWVVSSIKRVDEAEGVVYFEGFADTPVEKHLYKTSLDGTGDMERMTKDAGWHSTTVAAGGKHFIDNYSAPDVPPQASVKDANGEVVTMINENALDETHPYHPYLGEHAAREFGTIDADDGSVMHYALYRPADFDPSKRYPTIVNVYGGPGVQRVKKSWGIDFNQILARNGYVVFMLDNRGSTNRGKAFEDHIYRNMGDVEVRDQVRGVDFLKTLSFVDPERIGVWGWSYGGYMTQMLMYKAPDVFKAGISGAPVTDWRLYDTHYTERFLGHPDAAGDVYENSSVFKYMDGFKGKMLMVHGMADDNVFFDHTVKAFTAMQQRRKIYESLTYPGKRHRITGENEQAHMYTTFLEFFDRNIKNTN